jgi:hypothetical protein
MIRQDEIEHLFDDPVKNYERIMEMTRPPPVIVHKEYTGGQPSLANGDDQPLPPIDDDMIEAVAQALAETSSRLRDEFQSMVNDAVAPLTEQVATLQGQVSVLMNLIGVIVGNNNSIKEASETKIKTVRRVRQIESKHDRRRPIDGATQCG